MSSSLGRRLLLGGSFAFSQLVLLLLLRMPAVPGEGSWLQAMRGYFAFDQLSYAAIATTAAAGTPGLPEPFTETGFSYYPSLWYRLLGWTAALIGQSVPAAWTVLGYLLLAASIAALGWAGYRISGLPWAPALVGPFLGIGILAIALRDQWYVKLESHATLWGPFGSLYVLNAEVAAISCLGIAFAIILNVAFGARRSRASVVVWLSVAAALIGVTANLQTYAFFVGTGVTFAWLASYGLLRSRSRALLITTIALIAIAFPLGRVVAATIGALPVYGLLILSTLPGVVWIARRHVRLLLLPAAAFLLAAAPQAALVASGIARADDFLTYRQDVSSDLGVPLWVAALFALPIISVWLLNLAIQRTRRNDIVLAALMGLAFSGIMLTFNDAWGFGQEPYRMWIDSITVAALVLAPLTAWSISAWRSTPLENRSALVPVAAAAAIVLVGLSLLDFGSFRTYVSESGVYRFDTARTDALASLTEETTGLLANGPCIDAQELKIATRKPVAFYNAGLAWPENKAAIDVVIDAWRNGAFDPEAMRAAKVTHVITDSSCGTQWPLDQTMGVISVGTADYADEMGTGTLTLWRIA